MNAIEKKELSSRAKAFIDVCTMLNNCKTLDEAKYKVWEEKELLMDKIMEDLKLGLKED